METDVIVVGAGPGGATAAMALVQKGYDVIMFDRQAFPRDKVCGDGIPASALDLLYSFGMREKIENAGFYHIDKLRLVSPKGYAMDADLEEDHFRVRSAVVPRTQFDGMLQQHAVESGARFIMAQVKGPYMEDGVVKGVTARINGATETVRSRVVIAADGVTSSIARALRPDEHQDSHRAVALRAYIEDIEELPHQVEFYLYEEILPGYAWIFPTGEGQANIGLGMRLDHFRETDQDLKQMLQHFMDMPAVKKRLRNGGKLHDVATWPLNFGSQKNVQRAYDGALLIGDAAGLINPLTGGGISNALISATLAAETIHAAYLKDDFSYDTLQAYEEYCASALLPSLERSYTIQRIALHFPFVVDWLISRARQDSELAQTFMTKL